MVTDSPVRRLLHLSDLHLTGSGFDEDGVDARGSLVQVLRDLRFVDQVSAVVVTGDIADDGSRAGYSMAKQLVGEFAAGLGVPCVFTTGNHDDRDAFADVLGSGHLSADGVDGGELIGRGQVRCAVSVVGDVRVFSLDSLVPGAVHGELGDDQLEWLRDHLVTPAPAGSIVALHHPPIAVPGHPMSGWVLRDPERLGAVLAGTDVRTVLCGHLHHQMSSSLAGTAVWVTPGVVTRIDTSSPRSLVRGVLGGSATIVDLGDGPPVFRVVTSRDPAAGRQVYLYDARSGDDVGDETSVAPDR